MKILLLVCTLLVTGSAWAERVMYSTTATDTFYYDPATIRKDGNMRRVWWLADYKNREKEDDFSIRGRAEFDTKLERYKILGLSVHSEPMAGGTVLRTVG